MPSPSVSLMTGMILDQEEHIWVSSPQGLFREKANGGWEAVKGDLPEGSIKALSYDQRMNRMYAVVDSSNEIFASTDGRNWTSVYEGGYSVHNVVPSGDTLLVVTNFDGIVSFNTNVNAKLTAANGK